MKEQEENMKSKIYVSEVKDVGRVISVSGNYRQGTECAVVLWMREDHRILQLKLDSRYWNYWERLRDVEDVYP